MTHPSASSPVTFASLELIPSLLQSLHAEGYDEPTPIQQQAIPHVLKGRDLLGCAQTGTGKTAAFALPILQLLSQRPTRVARGKIRTLILTPTRELAAQIAESFERYGSNLGLSVAVIFGGVGQGNQVTALRSGTDVLVATPGRLLDLMEQRHVDLSTLEIFVLDEADRMLDMGFIHDVRRVLKVLPKQRQSLFFSATMPTDIQRLARDILSDPVKVEVTPVATTAEKIDQSIYFVETPDKRALLEHLLKDPSLSRALVFTRTKHGANKVAESLTKIGISAEAIHGNKSQNNRIRALSNFKEGKTRILVATDIAARGIDIDGVTHVINFDLPNIPESYVHRIGRTARAGAEGISISFCDHEERAYLKDIERLIRQPIRVVAAHPFVYDANNPRPERKAPAPSSHHGRSGGRGSSHRGQSQRQGGRPSSSRSAATSDSSRPASARPASRPAARASSSHSAGARHDSRARSHSHASGGPRGAAPKSRAGAEPARERGASGARDATPAPNAKPWWKRIVSSK